MPKASGEYGKPSTLKRAYKIEVRYVEYFDSKGVLCKDLLFESPDAGGWVVLEGAQKVIKPANEDLVTAVIRELGLKRTSTAAREAAESAAGEVPEVIGELKVGKPKKEARA
jgi:hypothetical protein